MKINLGYQVYSAREEAEKDLLSVLKQLKDMGYDGVEFAGFYGHKLSEVKAMLDEVGLVAASSHVPYQTIIEDMAGVIEYHNAIGCKYIAVPYLDDDNRPGGAGFATALRNMHAFGAMCRDSGITLLYHNHDFEFIKISGIYGLDFIYEAIPADSLQTEIDTCWVNIAGEVPADYIRKYAGRAPIVHLKDFVGGKHGDQPLYGLIKEDGSDDIEVKADAITEFDFRPVGYGVQDIPAIIDAGLEGGAEWFIVEQDRSSERPPLEAAKMSIGSVRKIEAGL